MRLAILLAVALVGLASSGGAQQAGASETSGEPEVTQEEIVVESSDWDDANPWGGDEPRTWFEDPSTVNCEKAPSWCHGNGTVKGA